jgi:phage terminase large subunit-like protein
VAKGQQRLTMGDLGEMLATSLTTQAKRPNINGYNPHPKQLTFHSSMDKSRLFLGGNRSGKTTAGVIEDIWWATGRHPYRETPEPPVRIRVIGVDFPNGVEKILLPEFARWVPITALKDASWEKAYDKQRRVLNFENGSFIEFMSADQELDKFAGTSRHLIHFDEEPPSDVWEENKARVIDTGGSMMLTMTPLLGLTWVYDDLYEKREEDNITVVTVGMDENPYLSPVEVEAFLSGLSPEQRKARGEGKFIAIGGLIFKKFNPITHVIEPIIPPKDWMWYQSLDHGINNPTAVLWHAVSPTGNIVTFSEHYAPDLTLESHAATIHAREASFGRVPDYRIIDPACKQRNAVTGDSIIAEYGKLGLNFIPGNNDVAVGIAKMRQFFEPRTHNIPQWTITENCPNFIRELQRYRYATFLTPKIAARSNLQEQPVKKDDHAIDSARYFCTFLTDLTPFVESQATDPKFGLVGNYDELLWKAEQQKITPDWAYTYGD